MFKINNLYNIHIISIDETVSSNLFTDWDWAEMDGSFS